MNDNKEAIRCLGNMEDTISLSNMGDFRQCAEKWKEIFSDDKEAIIRLKRGIAKEEMNSYKYSKYAETWHMINKNDWEINDLLEKAEYYAEICMDWYTLARVCKIVIDDKELVKGYLKKSEEFAENKYDWEEIAEVWDKYLSDSLNAFRCRSKANSIQSS